MNKIQGVELLKKWSKNISQWVVPDTNYTVERSSAIELLSYKRLDIVAKYIYAANKNEELNSSFSREVYLKSIEAFNNFYEADGSNKLGPENFLKSFEKLIDSLDSNGFDSTMPIPTSAEGVPIDGAHRVGGAMALDLNVDFVRLDVESPCFDYSYFKKRGLSNIYLDYLISAYAKIKEDTRLVLLWPTAEGQQVDVENILRGYGDIVYYKEIPLTRTGLHNLISLAYKAEPWVGCISDNFAGAMNKANWCSKNNGPLRIFVIESSGNLVKMKDEIRNLYREGKHSVHINDTHNETIELIECLLNDNSIKVLNARNLRKLPWFNRLFNHYSKWIQTNSYDKDKFCIYGSGVLAALGVRDVRDLDYLYAGLPLPKSGFKEIDCHNGEMAACDVGIGEIIYDPRNHFFYCGFKFTSVSIIRDMKILRDEPKDIEDVKMIESMLSGSVILEPWTIVLKKWTSYMYLKSRVKLVALKARYFLKKIFNKLGI